MSKYKISIHSYWNDSTSYYIGRSGENTTTVYADSVDEALRKVKVLRKDSSHSGTHNQQIFKVGNIEETES